MVPSLEIMDTTLEFKNLHHMTARFVVQSETPVQNGTRLYSTVNTHGSITYLPEISKHTVKRVNKFNQSKIIKM